MRLHAGRLLPVGGSSRNAGAGLRNEKRVPFFGEREQLLDQLLLSARIFWRKINTGEKSKTVTLS